MRSRSSGDPNSITTFPRFAPIWMETRVASCSENLEEASNDVLGLANGEVFGGDPRRQRRHRLLVAQRKHRARVTGGDLLVGQELLNVQRKREEPDRVRDV
jgi:hypothetical protein